MPDKLQPGKSAKNRSVKIASKRRVFTFKGVLRALRLTFISGPFLLFTSHLSIKHASLMIMLCIPALLLVFMTTVPALIFNSPDQRVYYEFANFLVRDQAQLAILPLAALCVLIAFAIPAIDHKPLNEARSSGS